MKKIILGILIILSSLVFLFLFFWAKSAQVNISAIVPGICGNGIQEILEQCDINDFGGRTCLNFGYSGGNLACNNDCTLNFSGCTLPPSPPPGGGGGGGGGGYLPPSPYGTIIISGFAYPKSEITLMSDGEIKATTKAGDDAKFEFTFSNLNPGNYLFALYSEDKDGRRSSLYTFPVKLEAGQTIRAGNILLSPSIDVDKLEVKRGDFVSIFGFTQPKSDVLINVGSDEELFFKTSSTDEGFYLYQLQTDMLDPGDHSAKSKSILQNQMVSNYSRAVTFKVGNKSVFKISQKCPPVDLNNDCRVNLIDFSILAYWYKRPKPPQNLDFNKDGRVDLIDFSILAYWWTG